MNRKAHEYKVFGVSKFKGKTAIIAGAEHPLGASLVRRLAVFGTRVVAIGGDETQLLSLAREAPKLIDTLPLQMGRRDVLNLLQEAWADEPIHIYVDAFPLCEALSIAETRDVFSRSAGLAAALAPGIRAGRARAMLLYPHSSTGPEPNRGTRAAGYAALVRHFSEKVAPGKFNGIAMWDEGCSWTGADCMAAGDAALMLCHPVSRGVRTGSVVEWSP